MEFQASAVDVRGDSSTAHSPQQGNTGAETDFLIMAGSRQQVGDLAAALAAVLDAGSWRDSERQSQPPDLWLDGIRLDPTAELGDSEIRAGARLGLGGPPPGPATAPNRGRDGHHGGSAHGGRHRSAAPVAELAWWPARTPALSCRSRLAPTSLAGRAT